MSTSNKVSRVATSMFPLPTATYTPRRYSSTIHKQVKTINPGLRMKTIFKTMLTAAAVTALAACSTDMTDDGANLRPDDKGTYVELGASQSDETTRADITIDGAKFTTAWDANDALKIWSVVPGLTYGQGADFAFKDDTKKFGGTLPSSETGAWKYSAFYPQSATAKSDQNMAYVPFGNARRQNGNTFNSACDAMVAVPVTTTNAAPGRDDDGNQINFKMHRVTTILMLDLSSAANASEKVQSVRLEADKAISSKSVMFKHNVDMTDGFDLANVGAKLDSDNAIPQTNSITLFFEEGTAPTVADLDAYFNLIPGTYSNFDVTVTTEAHKAQFSFTPAGEYVAGDLYRKTYAIQEADWSALTAPAMEWVGNADYAPVKIDATMDIKVNISADHGIKDFVVDINSPALSMLGISSLNLAQPGEMENSLQSATQLPMGEQLVGQTELSLDLSSLVPMILMFQQPNDPVTQHVFTLRMTDAAGNKLEKTLTFVMIPDGAAASLTYNNDADLWKNEATLSGYVPAAQASGALSVQYRRKGAADWQDAEMGAIDANGMFTATIKPAWTQTTNAKSQTVYTVDNNTGVFANATYEYQLTVDGTASAVQEFTTAAGDTIPYGDMEDTSLSCWVLDNANAPFWGSGNNTYMNIAALAKLCNQAEYTDDPTNHYAKLHGQKAVIMVAAGNLFTGTFNKPSTQGFVGFGQEYSYSARPTALNFKYFASIGNVDYAYKASQIPGGVTVKKGDPDESRIFVAIVDWGERHTVSAGLGDTTGGWDPEDGPTAVTEGKIIGYGSLRITKAMADAMAADKMVDYPMEILWYDKDAKPALSSAEAKRYSLVISCSTSTYGDYGTGSSSNELRVDDFEWVY